MKTAANIKQDQIVEAAIKRFSHYGINKTAITEIAEDLSLSKQSINYYFPDKQSLVAAVAGKIYSEYLNCIEEKFSKATNVEEGLIKLVEVKRSFFERYHQLAFPIDKADIPATNPGLCQLHAEAKEKNLQQVAVLLNNGVNRKELKPLDAVKTGRLVLATLTAFENNLKDKKAILNETDFEELHIIQRDVLLIILNGLKNEHMKN